MSSINNLNYEYDKKLKAIGDNVVIRRLEKRREDEIVDGVVIPRAFYDGTYGTQKAIVEDITEECSKKSGLKKGDKVIYDQCGVYYGFYPITVIPIRNIILKLNEEEKN